MQCPSGWSRFGHRCFIFIDAPKTWAEAEVSSDRDVHTWCNGEIMGEITYLAPSSYTVSLTMPTWRQSTVTKKIASFSLWPEETPTTSQRPGSEATMPYMYADISVYDNSIIRWFVGTFKYNNKNFIRFWLCWPYNIFKFLCCLYEFVCLSLVYGCGPMARSSTMKTGTTTTTMRRPSAVWWWTIDVILHTHTHPDSEMA